MTGCNIKGQPALFMTAREAIEKDDPQVDSFYMRHNKKRMPLMRL